MQLGAGAKVLGSLLCAVTVDLAKSKDAPLLKKYGIYNSGIVPQDRYTPGL